MNDLNMFAHGRGVGKSLLALKTVKKTYSFAMRIKGGGDFLFLRIENLSPIGFCTYS